MLYIQYIRMLQHANEVNFTLLYSNNGWPMITMHCKITTFVDILDYNYFPPPSPSHPIIEGTIL